MGPGCLIQQLPNRADSSVCCCGPDRDVTASSVTVLWADGCGREGSAVQERWCQVYGGLVMAVPRGWVTLNPAVVIVFMNQEGERGREGD